MEFGSLDFWRAGKTGVPGEKNLSKQGREPTALNPQFAALWECSYYCKTLVRMSLKRGTENGKCKIGKKPNLDVSPITNFTNHSLFCFHFSFFPFSGPCSLFVTRPLPVLTVTSTLATLNIYFGPKKNSALLCKMIKFMSLYISGKIFCRTT